MFVSNIFIVADQVKGQLIPKWVSTEAVMARDVRNIFRTDNVELSEAFRKYQCAAYKMMCALICNTKHELTIYESFLFKEIKSRPIWSHLINTQDANLYKNLTIEVDKRPKIKERLVSIRSTRQSTTDSGSQPKYIASQNIFESSLSQDVTKIDLSNSYVRTAEDVQQMLSQRDRSKSLLLEKNQINDHEIMATLCGVVEHMFDNKITPTNPDGSVSSGVQNWIKFICDVIENKDVHQNIRIFLVTLIDNCQHYFRNYAKPITKAVLKFLSDWPADEIDAIVVYLTVDLLEWDAAYRINTPEECQLASDLVNFYMQHACDERRNILQRHFELIRNLVEIWRDVIALPRQFLFDSIQAATKEENKGGSSIKSAYGIHLNGIILANRLIPWTEPPIDYLNALYNCVKSSESNVYKPAAQVLGMSLREIVNRQGENADEIQMFLKRLLDELEKYVRNDEKKFLNVIYGIHRHYETIVDPFLTRINRLIQINHGNVKRFYLEMFLSRITNNTDNIFSDVVSMIQSGDLLRSREFQQMALHIINKILSKITVDEIKRIFPQIQMCIKSKHSECRDIVYEIMKYIRDNVVDEELYSKSSIILLNGMNDIDEGLHSNILYYWSHDKKVPNKLDDRIYYLFANLYNADSDEHFLKFCTQLLLEPAINARDSADKILKDRNESDTKYTEYDINVDWKTQDSVLRVPLFSATHELQVNSDDMSSKRFLRATATNLMFDPTVDPSTIYQESRSFSLKSQNTLLFNMEPEVLDRRSQRTHLNAPTTAPSSSFKHLRTRFLRDKNQMNRERALKQVKRKDTRQIIESQQQKRKDGQVKLYRRYRFGDFPDFFINSLAFLMPLQVLVKNDMVMARQALVTIFNGIYKEVDIEQKHQFYVSIGEAVRKMLALTKRCEPMLFSTFIEIILSVNSATIEFEPDIAATIASYNHMMINGILLLENRLNYTLNRTDSLAYSSLTETDQNEHWTTLANMYYNLSEFDIAARIFANIENTNMDLPKAIEYEADANYAEALQNYINIINAQGRQSTTDFAYQSSFKCIEMMARWDDLEKLVTQQFDSSDELWKDVWLQQNFLPPYIQSETRLIINNKLATAEAFINDINRWLRDPKRTDYMKSHFAEQLMLLNMADDAFIEAKLFSENYFESFLSDWENTSILSEKVRSNKLLNVRRVAEINKYAISLEKRTSDESLLNELTERWNNTQMLKSDQSVTWESIISYRNFISNRVMKKVEQNEHNAPALNQLRNSLFYMNLKLSDIALQQNNVKLSRVALEQADQFNQRERTIKMSALRDITDIKIEYLGHKHAVNLSKKQTVENFVSVMNSLTNLDAKYHDVFEANPDIKVKQMTELASVAEKCFEIVSKMDAKEIDNSLKKIIMNATNTIKTRMYHIFNSITIILPLFNLLNFLLSLLVENIPRRIFEYCHNCWIDTAEITEKCEMSQRQIFATNFTVNESGIGETYNRLATFCLQNVDNESEMNRADTDSMIVESVLRGMKYHSKGARIQFPRLLQLVGMGILTLSKKFNEEVREICQNLNFLVNVINQRHRFG